MDTPENMTINESIETVSPLLMECRGHNTAAKGYNQPLLSNPVIYSLKHGILVFSLFRAHQY